ncbi:RNA-binding protein 44 [Amia ocellicauda]|uniref:RNA-binding protein 44 n=1 Tax=Amia ocellicauda TaxID=2972642 RepID=UPI003464D786
MALYLFDAHPTWTPAFLQGCRQGQVLLPPRSAALPLYVPLQGHPLAPEPGMGSFGVAPVDNVPFAIPFGQTHFCDMAALSWIDKEARKFHINRAVFDLVSPGGVLELTDPKLLGWYLSLAVEDRSLVQEEGGLLQFLQKHPALDVTRNCVYTKISGLYRTRRDHQDVPEMSSKLNKSRRPAFYSLSERRRCEHGFSLDAPKPGQSCPLPPPTLCLSEMERELLPRCIKQELNLSAPPRAPGSEAMVRGAGDTPLDFAERASAGEETLGRANTSLDVELELRGRETGVDECVPGPPGPSGAQAEQLSLDLEKETLPQYYSFSSSALDLTATRPGDWETEQCCGRVPAARHTMRQGGGGEAEVTDTSFTSSSLSSSSSSAALGASTDWPDEEQYLDCDFAGRVDASGDFEMEEPPASSRSTAQPIPRQAGDVASCAVPVGRDRRGVQTSDPSMGTRLGQWGGWALAEAELTRDASADPGELSCSQESFMSALPDDSLGVSPLAADGPGQEGERGTGEARGAFGTVPGLGAREGEEPGPVWSALQTSTEALAAPVTASQTGQDQVSRDTNAQPGPAHRRDVAVGTETPAKDRGTQTCPPTTAEKHVITDMYMSDLDYFVEEFLKLRAAEAELRELKDKAQSPAGGGLGTPGGCGSDCAQRAVKAELRLLALQYRLCEQHCWRLYYTAHEGALCSPGLPPPGSVLGALQGLCAQYREIRAQVQAGMSLDQLPPLSISCSCLVTERPYCPAQMMEEDSLLEEAPCGVEERCRGPVQHSAAETLQAAADGGAVSDPRFCSVCNFVPV